MSNSSKAEQKVPTRLNNQINDHETYRLKWSAAVLETIQYHHPEISPIGVHSWVVKDRENLIITGESIAFIVHNSGKIYETKNNEIKELNQDAYHEKQKKALKQGQTPTNEEARSNHWLSWKVTLNHQYNNIQQTIICHLKSTPQDSLQQHSYNGYKPQWHHNNENTPRYNQNQNQTRFRAYLGKIINHHQNTFEKSKSHIPINLWGGIEANSCFTANKESNATRTNWITQYVVQTISKYWSCRHSVIKELTRLLYLGIQKHRWKILCFVFQIIATKIILSPSTAIILIITSLVYLWYARQVNAMILKCTMNAYNTIAPSMMRKSEKSQESKHTKASGNEMHANKRDEQCECVQGRPTQKKFN